MPVNPESEVAKLARVARSGWLIRGVEQPETVADHVFGTLILCMLSEDAHEGADGTLAMALLHDIAEVRTGDLTPRTKHYVATAQRDFSYRDFETHHFDDVISAFPTRSRHLLSGLWREHHNRKTPRSVHVHVVDVVEMLSQAYEYEKTGQRKLDEFWVWVARCIDVPFLYALARSIERRRNFLKASASVQYQRFEAVTHHSGAEFAATLKTLEKNPKYRKKGSKTDARSGLISTYVARDQTLCREHVLDVGCGSGTFATPFLEMGSTVTGIDINPLLLERARKRWRNYKFVPLPPADVGWYWNVDSSSIDVVLIGEVLEHVFDPWFVLMEAFRVLRPDGRLFVSVPNSFHREKLERYTKEHRIEKRPREEHIRYFGPEVLLELLRETGFDIDELWGIDQSHHEFLLSTKPEAIGSSAEYAWTLFAVSRKKSDESLSCMTETPPPGRLGAVLSLQHRIEQHQHGKDWAQLHEFVEEINKAKLLRVDALNTRSETIAQQTHRLAWLAFCLAAELGLDCECAIRCVLLRGIIESHLAEIAPAIRGRLSSVVRRRALGDILKTLPLTLSERYLSFYDTVYAASDEGLIAEYLIARDFSKMDIKYNCDRSWDVLFDNQTFRETLTVLTGEVDS